MKRITTLLLALLFVLIGGQAFAQLDVRLSAVRQELLVGESIALKITLTNHTDRTITLDNMPGRPWLVFTLTESGNANSISPAALPRFPKTSIPAGARRSFQVDLKPYYRLNRANSYRAVASVRMPDQKTVHSSNRASFSLSFGGNMKSFAVQAGGKNLQMCVKLMHANNKDHLFGQVLDNDTRTVLGACVVGPFLNFTPPVVKLDRAQNLHVLCQSSPELFSYAVMGTNGKRLDHRVLKRVGGPVDLVTTGRGIEIIGLAPYVAPKPGEEGVRGASERPR